jgi:hypothetical protein
MHAVTDAGARIRFRYPWWLRPFVLRDVVGITLGRRIYLSADVAERQIERFLRHELAHVRQINRVGLIRFYWRYVREYIGNRRAGLESAEAYRRISFEEEARLAEDGT